MNCVICDNLCDRYMTYSGKQYSVCMSCFRKYANMIGFGSSVESVLELARFSELRSKGEK